MNYTRGAGIAAVIVVGVAVGRISHDANFFIVPRTMPTLQIPRHAVIVVGQSIELHALTYGARVVWHSMDDRLHVRTLTDKSCLVEATEPGNYKVVAYTVIGGTPSAPVECVVDVGLPEWMRQKIAVALPQPEIPGKEKKIVEKNEPEVRIKVYVVAVYDGVRPVILDRAKSLVSTKAKIDWQTLRKDDKDVKDAGLLPRVDKVGLPALFILREEEGMEADVLFQGRLPTTPEGTAKLIQGYLP